MFGRVATIILLCFILDGSSLEPESLAVREDGKYGHMIFDRIDRLAKNNMSARGYQSFDEAFSSVAQPKETILRARNMLIKDENSKTAQVTDAILSKVFLLTLIVGTGFGLIVKIMIWMFSSG